MIVRVCVLAMSAALLALPASAVVKVYNATPPGGVAGDVIGFSTTGCPPVDASPGQQQGSFKINDAGTGTVTLVDLVNREPIFVDFDTTVVFGPGSYVFAVSDQSRTPNLGTTHPGSTAPSGTIDWGIISGWTITGLSFCLSSPQTICTAGSQIPHGMTVPAPNAPSPTYDLGTWAFDTTGDVEATSPYIWATYNGGVANRQFLLRGTFVGGSIPALPLIGVGAGAVTLLVVGVRRLRVTR